jgi:hypothetical protein
MWPAWASPLSARAALFYRKRFSNSNYLNGGNDLFYELLKEVCKKKRTSPSAVCLALGMSKSNVTKWKAGSSPKIDTVVRIAKHLNVPVTRLIPKE